MAVALLVTGATACAGPPTNMDEAQPQRGLSTEAAEGARDDTHTAGSDRGPVSGGSGDEPADVAGGVSSSAPNPTAFPKRPTVTGSGPNGTFWELSVYKQDAEQCGRLVVRKEWAAGETAECGWRPPLDQHSLMSAAHGTYVRAVFGPARDPAVRVSLIDERGNETEPPIVYAAGGAGYYVGFVDPAFRLTEAIAYDANGRVVGTYKNSRAEEDGLQNFRARALERGI